MVPRWELESPCALGVADSQGLATVGSDMPDHLSWQTPLQYLTSPAKTLYTEIFHHKEERCVNLRLSSNTPASAVLPKWTAIDRQADRRPRHFDTMLTQRLCDLKAGV